MARSIRVLYRAVPGGQHRKNVNIPFINVDSAVVVTAAEFVPQFGGFGTGPKTLGRPKLGTEAVWVSNVGPHGTAGGEAGGVEFFLQVVGTIPRDIVVTITVVD